jgi:phosphatidylinositol alpha-mannosyltransferase
MKIGMLSPYSLSRPGGVQGQVFGLARALRRLGHEVTVLGPQDADRPIEGEDVVVVGHPTGLRSNGSVAPVTISPMVAVRTERLVRKGDFDVLHIHEPLAPMAPYGLIVTDPLPMVGTFHRAGVSRWVPVLKPLANLVGYRMDVKVAVSEAARETGIRSAGGEFEVLYNGIDVERFATAVPTPSDRPTVLFLGRHEARKGLSILLDAFTALDGPAVLWVAGDGPSSEVQRRRHPESDRIHWLGMLSDDEVASRAAGADILCAPSLRGESFGIVLLEAMAARCAVVASDLEGYRSAAGGQAELVPPGDPVALAKALGTAVADAEDGTGKSSPEALSAAAEHAQSWSMDNLAKRYVDVYQRAIERFESRSKRTPAHRVPRGRHRGDAVGDDKGTG